MRTVCVDWDDTLVDAKTQEWLPGAQEALAQLLTQFRQVIVYTAHANWPEGFAAVEAKLEQAVAKPWHSASITDDRLSVQPKPLADVYIDDRAVRFGGDWTETLANVAAGTSPKPTPAASKPHGIQTGYATVNTTVATARPTFKKRK